LRRAFPTTSIAFTRTLRSGVGGAAQQVLDRLRVLGVLAEPLDALEPGLDVFLAELPDRVLELLLLARLLVAVAQVAAPVVVDRRRLRPGGGGEHRGQPANPRSSHQPNDATLHRRRSIAEAPEVCNHDDFRFRPRTSVIGTRALDHR
jgi:hypothetical protein